MSEYDDKGKLLAVAASIVDGKKLLAGEWYKLEGGKFIHVDMSDNIFSRVKSIKKIGGAVVKTVIIDGEKKKSYVYISGGKSAHGVTVERPRPTSGIKSLTATHRNSKRGTRPKRGRLTT